MNTNNEAAQEQRPVKPIKPRSQRGRRTRTGDVPAPVCLCLERNKPLDPYKKNPDYDPQECVDTRIYALYLYNSYITDCAECKRAEEATDVAILAARQYAERLRDDEQGEADPKIVQQLERSEAFAESWLAEARWVTDASRRRYKEARLDAMVAYMMFDCQRQHDKSKDLDAEEYPNLHEPLPSV